MNDRDLKKAARREAMLNQDVSTDDIFKIMSGELSVDDIKRRRADKAARKAAGQFQNSLEREFATKTTGTLLSMLADYRKGSENYTFGAPGWWALKKVLAQRPHIWRGPAAKKRRRMLAQKNHGQSKGQNR